jgi:hypothetical protein
MAYSGCAYRLVRELDLAAVQKQKSRVLQVEPSGIDARGPSEETISRDSLQDKAREETEEIEGNGHA